MTDKQIQRNLLEILLNVVILVMNLCFVLVRCVEWGRIIIMSSVAGLFTFPCTIGYCTSKTGLVGLTKVGQTFAVSFARSCRLGFCILQSGPTMHYAFYVSLSNKFYINERIRNFVKLHTYNQDYRKLTNIYK